MLRLMLLFANYFLGGPEVLDLQFRNPSKSHIHCVLEKRARLGTPWNFVKS